MILFALSRSYDVLEEKSGTGTYVLNVLLTPSEEIVGSGTRVAIPHPLRQYSIPKADATQLRQSIFVGFEFRPSQRHPIARLRPALKLP